MKDLPKPIKMKRSTDRAFTILCIDDETANLKILSSVLKQDHQVMVAKSAKQGFDIAIDVLPDLIILDVVMPDVSGFDLIEKIKKSAQLKDIPVIFITGLNSSEDEEKGLLLGACDYIHKPFNHSIIRARVNTHLEIVRQRRLLEKFANFDSLTELPNRRKWEQDIDDIWNLAAVNGESVTIGMIDVDHFKLYNDHYGHQQGDIVLRKLSGALNRVLFDYKGKIYRYGGEEFIFYLPEVAHDVLHKILNECVEIVRSLDIEHTQSKVADVVTISLGAVEQIPDIADSIDSAIKIADHNLYDVKSQSRNSYAVSSYKRES
ncbi:diguanylate cyclase [Catenovulum sp. SM1970]|uniref:GGDEF domain-containing response regulator n=1 Tax=Marinifaba aquimaris TaxID=2741323 RepID=UPI00157320AE|nr:diguanylate cyclase [Marinifaba aquimaris]NTS78727.1 diguanylate cyclase [Marinifaba aquimaris]